MSCDNGMGRRADTECRFRTTPCLSEGRLALAPSAQLRRGRAVLSPMRYLSAEAVDPTVPRDAARALRRSRQAVPRAVIARETVLGAGVLRNAGSGIVGVQATDEPGITGVVIVGTLVASTAFPGAAVGLARANVADAEVRPAAPGVIRAVAPLVGAAVRPVAVTVPVADHGGVGSHALVVCAARFAGSGHAMMRRDIGEAASGCGQERRAPDQGAHEASPRARSGERSGQGIESPLIHNMILSCDASRDRCVPSRADFPVT
jgi:hypothetical protein